MITPLSSMRYIIAVPAGVEILASSSEVLVSQTLQLLVTLFSNAGLGELQKVAVFAGALEHCFAVIRDLPNFEEAWLLIRLLLRKNNSTRTSFLEDAEGPRRMFQEALPKHDTPRCRILVIQIALECLDNRSKERAQNLFFDCGYLGFALDCLSTFGSEGGAEAAEGKLMAFSLLTALLEGNPRVQAVLTEAQVRQLLLDAQGEEPGAAAAFEALALGNPGNPVVPSPDLNRPMTFRLAAACSACHLSTEYLLTALREQNIFSIIGTLYYFISRQEQGILDDGILTELLVEQVLIDDGAAGGLAACLLLDQLARASHEQTAHLRTVIAERIGEDVILARLDRISQEERLVNRRILAPFVDQARREVRPDAELIRLRQQASEQEAQIRAYQFELKRLEQEHTELVTILAQYDKEIYQLKAVTGGGAPAGS